MNSHALLTSQGWRGTGHSLHASSDSIGLSRPLLVAQKQNTLGVGKKQHKTSDMWWMNAFDKSLKGLDTSVEGVVVQRETSGGLDMVKRGGGRFVGKTGLYGCFVRGEVLGGTIGQMTKIQDVSTESSREASVEVQRATKKRRLEKEEESKEERRARKAAKISAIGDVLIVHEREVAVSIKPSTDSERKKESKTERIARKAAKLAKRAAEEMRVAEPQTVVEKVSVEVEKKKESKEERRARKAAKLAAEQRIEEPAEQEESITKFDTKDERTERKRQKKLQKEAEVLVVVAQSEKIKKKKRRRDAVDA
jgi:nucleolar protein TMA23